MAYSTHPATSQTPMPYRGTGVSKKLYNTNTQPRSNNYNPQLRQHTQYYERQQHNVINNIGLEIGCHQSNSQQLSNSYTNGSTSNQLVLPTKSLPAPSDVNWELGYD